MYKLYVWYDLLSGTEWIPGFMISNRQVKSGVPVM